MTSDGTFILLGKNMFDPSKIDEYDKNDLINFWISLREGKKKIEDDIKLITMYLLEEFDIDREKHWEYNVFLKQTTSYKAIKWFDYGELMNSDPDLFQPAKAKMYKKYPDAITRTLTNTIEMSKDKDKKHY